MRVYASVEDVRMPLTRVAAHARRAEVLGFDGLIIPEAVNDAILAACLALEHTTRLEVVTGVVVAFARSPMLLAQDAWGLAQLSGGRFTLGLGPQIKGNIEGRFGMPWSAPAARMRDYVGAVKAVFDCWQTGERLAYESPSYSLSRMQPFFAPDPLPDGVAIPIALGAVGPRMTEVAGEVADLVIAHPTNSSPGFLRDAMAARLAAGAARVSRIADRVGIIANPMSATGLDTAAVEAERHAAREVLAFTYSTPAYAASLVHHGWEDVGTALRARARAGDWAGMREEITDEMLDTLVPSGTFDEIAAILQGRYAGVADGLTLRMPADPVQDGAFRAVIETLRAS
jgi:probable F420-dependent oxidoreductase